MQGQTEHIVTKGSQKGLGVEQPLDTSPSDFLLQLVKAEVRRRQQDGRRASRNVVAQEGEDIDQDRQTERDDKGDRAGELLAAEMILMCCEDVIRA